LATSEAFFGEEAGWFRISFAVDRDILHLGLTRYNHLFLFLMRMMTILQTRKVHIKTEAQVHKKADYQNKDVTGLFNRLLGEFTISREVSEKSAMRIAGVKLEKAGRGFGRTFNLQREPPRYEV